MHVIRGRALRFWRIRDEQLAQYAAAPIGELANEQTYISSDEHKVAKTQRIGGRCVLTSISC